MSARTWTAADPAPRDWPVVVGPDDVTWGHDLDGADGEGNTGLYVRQEIKHQPGGRFATFGPVGQDFVDIFDHYEAGAELREATDDEACTWVETWGAR